MKLPLLLVVCVSILPGCVQTAAPAASSPPASQDLQPANETASLGAELTHVLEGGNVTRNESVTLRVSTTGPVTVNLRFNGTVLASEVVEGEKSWPIALPFGQSPLELEWLAGGMRNVWTTQLTRLAPTTLTIDYCHFHPSSPSQRKVDSYEYWVDLDSRPTLDQYAAVNGKHIDAFTAHDQLWVFHLDTAKPIETTYHASLEGFFLDKVDGAPVNTAGGVVFWNLQVNGATAETGMSLVQVRAGDRLLWELPCA